MLYPADGTSAVALTEEMARLEGISYLRTTREATPALYGADEAFPVGGSKTLVATDHDDVTLVGAGVTLHECLAAHDLLGAEGITARVIDCYSVKPIDARHAPARARRHRARSSSSRTTGSRAAWATRCSMRSRRRARSTAASRSSASRDMPGSATPEELRAWAGIDAAAIARRPARRWCAAIRRCASASAVGMPPNA